ncbi:uncharacterized protein LOC112556474 [Pomacea canaliculata]|uniref:uncharacterized protein LOC112556474 n=1 Tax=Pomacea canaliculata TaxID=400727 RepID=UPI000D73FBD7|nr:uncharacterized protein LOC112556474 [Pomacea canaliculata]
MDIRQQKGEQSLCKTQNMASQRDQQNFQEKLKDFPHFFQLQGCSELKMERKLSILSRLESERTDKSNYVTPAEVTAMNNVTAFILFLTNDKNKAVRETEKVLTSFNNENNIVALANMAVIKWKMGDRAQGEEILQKLNGLRSQANFEERVMDAEAEMGYCYSRLGLPFALRAVSKFEKVVEARPLDYTWKLGLALTLRRLTHINSHNALSSIFKIKAREVDESFRPSGGN